MKKKAGQTEKMSGPLPSSLQVILADRIYSGRKSYPRPFSTGSSDWPPSRIRNFTRRRR